MLSSAFKRAAGVGTVPSVGRPGLPAGPGRKRGLGHLTLSCRSLQRTPLGHAVSRRSCSLQSPLPSEGSIFNPPDGFNPRKGSPSFAVLGWRGERVHHRGE